MMTLTLLMICVVALGRAVDLRAQLLELDEGALERQVASLEDYLQRLARISNQGATQLMLQVIEAHRANKGRRDPLAHLQRLLNSHATQTHYIRKRFLREPIDERSKMAPSIVALVLFQVQEDAPLQALLTRAEKAQWARQFKAYSRLEEWTPAKRALLKNLQSRMAGYEEVRRLMQRFDKSPGSGERKFTDQVVARLAKVDGGDDAMLRVIERYRASQTGVERQAAQREIHRLWRKSTTC